MAKQLGIHQQSVSRNYTVVTPRVQCDNADITKLTAECVRYVKRNEEKHNFTEQTQHNSN